MTSSYGIQALINNVHRSYVSNLDHASLDDTEEMGGKDDKEYQLQESEILRFVPKFYMD